VHSSTIPPVDLTVQALLTYEGGVAATLTISFVSGESQSLRVLTSDATIEVTRACTPTLEDTSWRVTKTTGTTIRQSPGADPYQEMVDQVFEAFTIGEEPYWDIAHSRRLATLLFRLKGSVDERQRQENPPR
jgi:predicted dehydrogenase